MANAKRKQKQNEIAAQRLALAPVPAAPAAVLDMPVAARPVVMVTVQGGDKVDAGQAPIVRGADIQRAGTTFRNLALNILAGTVDAGLFQRDADFWKVASGPDKTAFFKLAALKQGDILEAWEKRQASSERKISPTLQGLAKLFKNASSGMNPYAKLKEAIRAIIENKQWTAEGKIQRIAELVKADE